MSARGAVHWSLYARLVGVAALWGGTFIAGRIAAPQLPHFTLAALRFWIAAALLLPLLMIVERGLPRLRPRDWLYTALLALSGLVTYNLLFLGALVIGELGAEEKRPLTANRQLLERLR